MAKYPDFIYETVGTALFTLISSAAIATASGFTAALYFALIWALCHTTFKDRCQAYFKVVWDQKIVSQALIFHYPKTFSDPIFPSPVLSLGHHVSKGGDLADLFATIVAQFLGSFVGIYLMSALGLGGLKKL